MSCSGIEFDIVELLIPCDLVKVAGERKGYERLLGSVLEANRQVRQEDQERGLGGEAPRSRSAEQFWRLDAYSLCVLLGVSQHLNEFLRLGRLSS